CAANSCACADMHRKAESPWVPCLPPARGLPLSNFRHRLLVLVPFSRVIELRIAQGDLDGVMAHQFFENLQWHAGIEQLCREGMPQTVRRIMSRQAGYCKILLHEHVDLVPGEVVLFSRPTG